MGRLVSSCNDISFNLKGNITCGAVGCANWMPTSLKQICKELFTLTDKTINTAIAADTNTDLFGSLTTDDAGVGLLLLLKTIYLQVPYVVIFLGGYSIPL